MGGGAGRGQPGRRRRPSRTSAARSPRTSTRPAQPGWRRGELGAHTLPCPPAACPGEGRSLQGLSPLPPGTAHLPPAIIPRASPHAASRLLVSLLLPCPRSLQTIVWRSWHAPLARFPSECSQPGACNVFFCPSKFPGFITSSSRKIHHFGRAIIGVTSSVSAA